MPQIPDTESNFGACEEHGLESSPSDKNPRGGHFHSEVIGMLIIFFRV